MSDRFLQPLKAVSGTFYSPDEYTFFTEEVIETFVGKPFTDGKGNIIGSITKAWSDDGGRSIRFEVDIPDA